MINWQWIADDDTLREVLGRYADATEVAVDTEFMRRNTYYPQVALLQLCFDDTAWLIDPLAIEDLAPLQELMQRPELVKVLHSPSEDLEVFKRWLGALPRPLFDTQRALPILGGDFGLGYRGLVLQRCGIDLPKEETRSDWLQRPLSEAQCTYAAQDVTYLLTIYRSLRAQSEQRGRLDWVLADGEDALEAQEGPVASYLPRFKAAWKLDRRQLAALAGLSAWRDETARAKDKPRSWIIDDPACLQIARTDPASLEQLRTQVDLPAPALRRYGDEILAVLEKQRALPESALPAPLPGPLSAKQRDRVKALKRRSQAIAEAHELAPEILLASRDFEALVREHDGETVVSEPVPWQGWRGPLVIEPLRNSLKEDVR